MTQTKNPDKDFAVVIPARYASSRLPGKPLLQIGDKTLIQHVCHRASLSNATEVIVATDDVRIHDHVIDSGYTAVMTDDNCESGTDRIAQAVKLLDFPAEKIIVNLQGDEPFMPAAVINLIAQTLANQTDACISTGCELLVNPDEWNNPDVVKVVKDKNKLALYFSRSILPYIRDEKSPVDVYKHLGIYAYTARYVTRFSTLETAPLEITEKLEQLRALWHGDKIIVATVNQSTGIGVDTPEDLASARALYSEMMS